MFTFQGDSCEFNVASFVLLGAKNHFDFVRPGVQPPSNVFQVTNFQSDGGTMEVKRASFKVLGYSSEVKEH